jgi:hypothetical protein
MWAHFERTPFGHGRPYSSAQMSHGLREAMFTPHRASAALYVPPVSSRMLLSSAGAWEKVGQRWFTSFAGVVVFEATKQIYAGNIVGETVRQPAYAPAATR